MNGLFYKTNLSANFNPEYLSFLTHNLPQSPLKNAQLQQLFALQGFPYSMPLPSFIPHTQDTVTRYTEDMSTPDSRFSATEEAFRPDLLYTQVKTLKFEESVSSENVLKTEDGTERNSSSDLKTQIEGMVKYFIQEFDNNNQNKAEYQRRRYAYNSVLLDLFDSLKQKYCSAWKCREDMLRLALRKALTFLRDSLRKQLKITAKAASVELCKRYSEGKLTNCTNEEELINYLLPYKKNSKYSTPNLCFIREIFSSETFAEDYIQYLSKIDQILEEDNDKKIPKFVDFLVECVKNNTLKNIKAFKRLPWLKTWLKATKIIAAELLEVNSGKGHQNGQSVEAKEKKGAKAKKQQLC